jgi:acyl-CoA synthetase (AMP-forming)/AMP-acid ligase II
MLSHRALTQVAYNVMIELGAATTASSILLPQPLSHGAGYFVLPYLACGGHLHVMPRFDPQQAVALGRQHGIRTLKLVPTMLLDILATGEALPYEDIIYGAAPIAQPLLEEALDRYGPVLSQIYGQSEAPMTITYLSKADHQAGGERLRSAGRPWRSVAVEVVGQDAEPLAAGEVGEVVVRGPHLMTGYYGQPELTAEALRGGRLWTRDLATCDDQGYLYLLGRTDDIINSGGFNIAPREVEDVVARYEGVREVAAVGIPDERWGQAVRVYVVPEPGAELEGNLLIEFCKQALGFRRPRSVVVVPDLPRTSYGKIDRERLGREAVEQAARR